MTYLKLQNIHMKYQNEFIINDLNLNVERGELLILLGSSGCGKTSLLKIIAGLSHPEQGKIIIGDKDITEFSPQRREIGYVPQSQVLFPHLNIKENIAFGLRARNRENSKDTFEQKIQEVAKLAQIEDLLARFPSEISGGQKQRVALARAIVINPKLLLLDEPLSSIDASSRESLALMIKRIQRETKTTTIYVTHNQQEARLIADRVAIMYNGIIQQSGTMIDIDNNPKNFQIAHIMGQLNIWEVNSQKFEQGNLIISSPLGDITIVSKEKKNVTGIKIHPNKINLFNEDEEIKQTFNEQSLIISGKIITIIQLKSKIYQIIIQIDQNDIKKPFNYLKMQSQDQVLINNLSINQNITLKIDPKDIILF
ncbi:MAG: ABC transporter ATP-binding protein [Promethearchaeota archaeon]